MKTLRNLTIALILIFVALYAFRSEDTPAQVHTARHSARHQSDTAKNNRYNLDQKVDLKDLKYAYTGNWDKNNPYNPASAHSFNHPQNTRSQIGATTKQAQKNKKKKKQVSKNKPFKYKKYSRTKNPRTNSFDFNGGYPFTNTAAKAPDVDDKKMLTVEEWYNLILAEKEKAIYKLVHDYEGQLIDTATFYQIVDKLLATDDDTIRKLSYIALGSTPSLPSLEKHIASMKNERSSVVKNLAESTIQIYSQVQNVRFLNFGLSNENIDVKITSANMIKSVVLIAIQSQQNVGSGGTDTDRNPAVFNEQSLARYRIVFSQTLAVLNGLLEGSTDTQVQSSFNDTRTTLVQFLG